MAGVSIDFHDRHVGAEGIGEVRRIVEARGFETGFHPLRQIPCDVRHQRNVLDRLVTIRRTLHEELAVGIVHVLHRRLEEVAGQQFGLFLDLPRRYRQRRAADGGRPAAIGPPAHGRVIRITVHDLDVVDRKPELVGHDLGKRRFLSLPVRRRADEHVDLAGRMHPDDRALPEAALEPDRPRHLGRPEAADFNVGADADADVPPTLAGGRLIGAQLVVADVRQRLVERRLVVPAVVLQARSRHRDRCRTAESDCGA